jgi:hypothetical protein
LIRLLLQRLESFRCTASQRFGLRSITLLSNRDGSSDKEQRDYRRLPQRGSHDPPAGGRRMQIGRFHADSEK